MKRGLVLEGGAMRGRSDGATQGEVIFPRCDETELGQPADFRRKRAALDAEEVCELLPVEGNVEFVYARHMATLKATRSPDCY